MVLNSLPRIDTVREVGGSHKEKNPSEEKQLIQHEDSVRVKTLCQHQEVIGETESSLTFSMIDSSHKKESVTSNLATNGVLQSQKVENSVLEDHRDASMDQYQSQPELVSDALHSGFCIDILKTQQEGVLEVSELLMCYEKSSEVKTNDVTFQQLDIMSLQRHELHQQRDSVCLVGDWNSFFSVWHHWRNRDLYQFRWLNQQSLQQIEEYTVAEDHYIFIRRRYIKLLRLQQWVAILHTYGKQRLGDFSQSSLLVAATLWSTMINRGIVSYHSWHRWKARYLQNFEYKFDAGSKQKCVGNITAKQSYERKFIGLYSAYGERNVYYSVWHCWRKKNLQLINLNNGCSEPQSPDLHFHGVTYYGTEDDCACSSSAMAGMVVFFASVSIPFALSQLEDKLSSNGGVLISRHM
ncbi:PREDICTED: uncharacterized protein LOC104724070 [Camelina sativa]|uniref:Uncharacterized protein LOC104724070 n=1 Tax=Camelina sativa TaxID=90675 RepID=A0ABM0UGI5_CAMSA|nr:PREDICTED: uncharacterized protein LOC104724070 [Camelina sativa]